MQHPVHLTGIWPADAVYSAQMGSRKITEKDLKSRPVSSWEYGYWWIEWGGHLNTIRDNERIRFELLGIVMVSGITSRIQASSRPQLTGQWIG